MQSDTTYVLTPRPPIVAVLGHVDHGKTSLLDTIRKSEVAKGESGGITQHIGAYQIEVKGSSFVPTYVGTSADKQKSNVKGEVSAITFIDTPGHEAFAKMRSRGSQIADIAILVVAATEGVKPQTEESISHIKKAGIPLIVALNKIDLPQADPDKVKQQLAKAGVLVESYGGDVVIIPVSAKTGAGIDKLLEAILLVSEMNGLKADSNGPFSGVVIESKLDKHTGPLATIIVKNGSLKIGQTIFTEQTEAKVRALMDSRGRSVKLATPSTPVEIMGWKSLPLVGSLVSANRAQEAKDAPTRFMAMEFKLPPISTVKKLNMILKSDTAGTLEAIKEALGELVSVVQSGIGEITESDVLMAKSTGSVIIGFNLKLSPKVVDLGRTEKVRIKVYHIIYELLEEIAEVTSLLNKPEAAEQILGEAVVLAQFEAAKVAVAGCRVEKGRVSKNDTIKLVRKDVEIARTRIKSLRHGKNDIAKAETPSECGIIFDKKLDFVVGDRIIAYKQQDLLE